MPIDQALQRSRQPAIARPIGNTVHFSTCASVADFAEAAPRQCAFEFQRKLLQPHLSKHGMVVGEEPVVAFLPEYIGIKYFERIVDEDVVDLRSIGSLSPSAERDDDGFVGMDFAVGVGERGGQLVGLCVGLR